MQKSRAASQLQSWERKLPSKLMVMPFSWPTLRQFRISWAQLGDRVGVMPLRWSQSKPFSRASKSTVLKSYSVMAECLRS